MNITVFLGYKFIQYYLLNNNSEAFGVWIEFSWTNWSPAVPWSSILWCFKSQQDPGCIRPRLSALFCLVWNMTVKKENLRIPWGKKKNNQKHCYLIYWLIPYLFSLALGRDGNWKEFFFFFSCLTPKPLRIFLLVRFFVLTLSVITVLSYFFFLFPSMQTTLWVSCHFGCVNLSTIPSLIQFTWKYGLY